MTMRSPEDDSCIPTTTHSYSLPIFHPRGKNVLSLLAQREIAPRSKNIPRWHWGNTFKQDHGLSFRYHNEVLRDPRRDLLSWVEAESLRRLLANYCPLVPQPKSTIAISFSFDGKMLASTHGDHTVKIIDCQTGICLKVLGGHLRTPWVVRFHPKNPEILASGSLDQEIRLWNTLTSTCISSVDFYRPIASIAFHAEGEVLAIASGHKLYIWRYEEEGETSLPAIVLKTRHSLRAVSFHPHGGPFLLTAEANDIKSSDSLMTKATSIQSSNDSSPAIYVANLHLNSEAPEPSLIPLPSSSMSLLMKEDIPLGSSSRITTDENLPIYPVGESVTEIPMTSEVRSDSKSVRYRRDQVLNPTDSTRWRVPFLQGWLIGRIQSQSQTGTRNIPVSEIPYFGDIFQSIRRDATPVSIPDAGHDFISVDRVQSEIAASMIETADTDLPCTVKLRIWSHNIQNPCNPLKDGCRLTIPYVVLCSEMGAHFSPCGRFVAACVACLLPQNEADLGLFPQFHQDVSTSPTQHPISDRQVIFELRIYSLEESTFGSVLVSRPIRAAHCLTSIQFSPTSEHILLAYGRRHSSLLKSIVIDGETASPVYTVLEVFRVSDMQLVSVLPSAEDEVNVAAFHPSPGGGLVYGTKEGKVRFFKFEGSRGETRTKMSTFLENIVDVV